MCQSMSVRALIMLNADGQKNGQLLVLCVFSFVFISPSDGLIVVGVHSAKFPNEKVGVFTSLLIEF